MRNAVVSRFQPKKQALIAGFPGRSSSESRPRRPTGTFPLLATDLCEL
jgi:hypothetical protein